MDEVSFLQKAERGLTSIKQLGLYKLLFSQKVAFCFVILFIMTGVVSFSSWAVVKHFIDPATYGTVIVTFGGIVATLAGIYNIVHGMNDRAALAAQAALGTPPPPPVVAPVVNPPPPDANLPPNGTL